MIDDDASYQALASRDVRFDGVFFVGVTSTDIYCRPVCPAKTPMRRNCRFFRSAEEAEKAGFRPCLRCRPELAPGTAPVDKAGRISERIVRRIEEGLEVGETDLERIAGSFGVGGRQLRRIVRDELGVSPIELVQTRRLLLAKQLLTETKLPVTEVAFASGFSSLRRFNDAFVTRYRMAPGKLRKEAAEGAAPANASDETSTLRMTYRPPYDWEGILDFLRVRAMKHVELVADGNYARTVELGGCRGWVKVSHGPEKRALMVEFSHSLTPVLPGLLGRLRRLFDVAARPDLIAERFAGDRWLGASVAKNPGLRVPGAFDGFEQAMRAILGQQVTVKAATTLAGRFAKAFGEEFRTPFAELCRLSPQVEAIAAAGVDDVAGLGVPGARAAAILGLAMAFRNDPRTLEAGGDPEVAMAKLRGIPGIGPWTAHYIAMRALRWPDAFPKEDIVIRNRLGGVSAAEADAISQAWSPWRSYAVLHLWRSAVTSA